MMAALKNVSYINKVIQMTTNQMLFSALLLSKAICTYVNLFFISF
jgi:hypothetical protein